MAGTISDILINCTETLITTSRTRVDGFNGEDGIVDNNDQIQVGMTISGLTGDPIGVLVKSLEKVATGLKVTFGAPADNAAASYQASGNTSLTFTNEGTPSTYTGGTPLSIADNSYVNSGVPGSKSSFVKTFTADADHVFKVPPSISLKGCANPSDYTVSIVDTKNSAGFLTARIFTVTVKINKTSTSDKLAFNARAEAGFNPSVNEVTNYSFNTNNLNWHGGTRELKIHGDEGANFKLRVQKSVAGGTFSDKIAETTFKIPKGGVYSKNIRFNKITSNTYFLFTLSEASGQSTFVELPSPHTFGVHQQKQNVVRSYSIIGKTTANGQGAWTASGNHNTAGAVSTGLANAFSSAQSLRLSVTASNSIKFIQYNSSGTSGFSSLASSSFKDSLSFSAGVNDGQTDTRLVSYASATDNPARAWSAYSGGTGNSTSGSAGASVNKLAPVFGKQRTIMTRNFSTEGKSELFVDGAVFNNTAQWDKENGVNAWTASGTVLTPVNGTSGFIAGKLNSPYLEAGKTYALTYTIKNANGGTTDLKIRETGAGNETIDLPTSIGTHTVHWTQGPDHHGQALGGTFTLTNNTNQVNGQWLRILSNNTNANASMQLDDLSLKRVAFDDHVITATTALKLWNGTQPENFTVELTAAEPRLQKNMEVRGVGINAGTIIKNVEGKLVTLSSSPASAVAKGATLSFYPPATILEASDIRFKMTQGVDQAGGNNASKVEIESTLAIASVGSYDIDLDLDLGAFVEADTSSLPVA